MKKIDNFVKGFGLFIITVVALLVISTIGLLTPVADKKVESVITDQDIAEFAVEQNRNYEGIVEVKIDNVGYNEILGCDVIDCYVYVDGELKAYTGINRDWYLRLLEKSRENS